MQLRENFTLPRPAGGSGRRPGEGPRRTLSEPAARLSQRESEVKAKLYHNLKAARPPCREGLGEGWFSRDSSPSPSLSPEGRGVLKQSLTRPASYLHIHHQLLARLDFALGQFGMAIVTDSQLDFNRAQFFPLKDSDVEMVSREEFDNVDIAVLRTFFKQGPGMATSAPELAEQLRLRPAQIQHRLDNLMHNHMVRSVIGTTDGFENYRLTDSGLAFITMMQRQARVTASVSPASASGSG